MFLRGSILGPFLFLINICDLPQLLSENDSYFIADDKRVFYQDKDVHKIEDVLITFQHSEKGSLITCYQFILDKT